MNRRLVTTTKNNVLDVDDAVVDDREAEISLREHKVSNGMRRSLENLINILQCPLCHQLFRRPVTLASCGHSFCEDCIEEYNRRANICPVEGCHMPMSIVGGGGHGSYRRFNPQLAQCVESIQLICHGLNTSPDHWWKKYHTLEIIQQQSSSSIPNPKGSGGNVDDDDRSDESGSDSEMGDAIDLQATCPMQETLLDDDDDDW